MEPNANPAPAGPKPIQDVVPPHNPLGNPENLAQPVPEPSSASRNPIAGTAVPQSQAPHDNPAGDQALEGVLKDVTNNIKAAPPGPPQPKSAKPGLLGFLKKKPNAAGHPPLHAAPRPAGAHQAQLSNSQQALPTANPHPHQTAANPLKSGPVPAKKKSIVSLPAIAAVIVAIILIALSISAFKN